MKAREFKDKVYGELSGLTRALANPKRLEIMDLLGQGRCSVEYIANQTNLSIANASQHLQVLKSARLVAIETRGKYRYYTLANTHVFEVWASLRDLTFSHNAEIKTLIQAYRKERHSLESVSCEELLRRIKKDEVIVLDVRPEEEYKERHIAQSVSIPAGQLSERLQDLPKDKEIVAYCRGPLCVMADESVKKLRSHGFMSRRLEGGYPDWMALGLPVEQNT